MNKRVVDRFCSVNSVKKHLEKSQKRIMQKLLSNKLVCAKVTQKCHTQS